MKSQFGQALYKSSTIQNELSLSNVISRVEIAFRLQVEGNTQMPAKNYLLFDQYDGDLRSMSSYIPSFDLATVKVVNSHPNNPDRHHLPTVMALIVAVEPETGSPIAVLDGTKITALRTAAASAVATKFCTDERVETLGIIGAGGQANDQVRGQLSVRDFSSIVVYDIETSRSNKLIEDLKGNYQKIDWSVAESIPALIDRSDVVNSLTPSKTPLIDSVETSSLQHINAMGADGPGKQEWPIELLHDSDIYFDEWEQARHSGEIHTALGEGTLEKNDLRGPIGELIADDRQATETLTLFDSTGLAIQDTAATKALLESDVEPDTYFPFLTTEA